MWSYDVDVAGAPAVVLTAPTTAGVVTIACRAGEVALQWTTADCDEVAASMRLDPPASWIVPSADTALRLGLPAVLAKLNDRRASGRAALAATSSPAGRRAAAASVARAYARAARAAAPLAAPADADVPRRLNRLSRRYVALARASASRDAPQARRAGAAIVRDEQRLQRRLGAPGT
jgi:hypothetical protein